MSTRWRRRLIGDIVDIIMGEDEASRAAKQREDAFAATMYRKAAYENPNSLNGYQGQGMPGAPMGYPGQGMPGAPMGYPGQPMPGMQSGCDPQEFTPQQAVNESMIYADEINDRKDSVYPAEEVLRLSTQLQEDYLTFLGYIYDPGCADPVSQVAYANQQLAMQLSNQEFFQFRNQHSMDPQVAERVPDSLVYYVKDDLSGAVRPRGSAMSMSRFLVNTYRDLGIAFTSFGGFSELKFERLTTYLRMMNDYLKENGLYKTMDPYRRGNKGDPSYGLPGSGL